MLAKGIIMPPMKNRSTRFPAFLESIRLMTKADTEHRITWDTIAKPMTRMLFMTKVRKPNLAITSFFG